MVSLPPPNYGQLSSKFGDALDDNAMAGGVTAGYPILRIKGKVWTITRAGAEPHVLMRPDNDGPRNSVELVLLAASQHLSKVYYEQYEDGAAKPPECFSHNGIVPHPSSTKKQNVNCASCPQNQWGSRITAAGKPGKACRDSKRIAVSPLGDIRNETFGGPMLLRVPADSLTEFKNYSQQMRSMGFPYFTVGTKISFDPNQAYPKLVLTPLPPLNDEQADAVMDLRAGHAVKEILSEGSELEQEPRNVPAKQLPTTPAVTPQAAIAAPKAEAATTKTETKTPPAKQQAVDPVVKAEAAVTKPVATEVVTKEETFEKSLEAQLDNLLSDAN